MQHSALLVEICPNSVSSGYFMNQKKILIIAGPNGAGKTTFAREFLPNEAGCPVFINADLIAAGLSPFQPEIAAIKAGRLMLEEIAAHAERTLLLKRPWLGVAMFE